jgi:hypothetical protein
MGDIVYGGGRVYVPMEGCDGRDMIWVLDADLRFLDAVYLPTPDSVDPITGARGGQTHASWIAVHPKTGYLFSSDHDTSTLNVYSPVFESAQATLLYTVRLDAALATVQGGEFSDRGFLYIAVGSQRVKIYDINGSQGTWRSSFIREIDDVGIEMEGLTVWDVTGQGAPNISGQIHYVVLNNDSDSFFGTGKDNVYIKHITVNDPDLL